MKYLVFDLETQTKTFLKRKASPFCGDNYIVAAGWKRYDDDQCKFDYYNSQRTVHLNIEDDIEILVGFNIKFDLLWQWENPSLKKFLKRGGKIWCCQYAEYLLNGQDRRFHFPNLNDTAPRYGGTKKVDEVKLLWESGVETSDIDKDLLIDYLVGSQEEGRNGGDIGNTEKVFLGQIDAARESGMLKAMEYRMDGLLCTTEMEYNGLFIDIEEARKQLKVKSKEKDTLQAALDRELPEFPDNCEFNWNSNAHKSCLLFGGSIGYREQDTYIDKKTGELARFKINKRFYIDNEGGVLEEAPDNYMDVPPPVDAAIFSGGKKKGLPKTKLVKVDGELKTKYIDKSFKLDGYVKPRTSWETSLTDALGNPIYKTTAAVIEAVSKSGVPFCEKLARYEQLCKELGTYFVSRKQNGELVGMLTCVNPDNSIINHNLNHTSTVTSRLSSNNPNLQNIPRGDTTDLKRMFASRFGEAGMLLEIDFSQLEIVVQALLTGDKQLIMDLNNKIDFHCKRVAMQPAFGVSYDEVKALLSDETHPDYSLWKSRRTAAKIFSFQRAYGAGAKLIASSTGMDIEQVEELIEAEKLTYPQIESFNENVKKAVEEDATPFRDPSLGFGVFRRGQWQSPTGCLYSFRSYPAPDFLQSRGIRDTFSPTELKNYPIQGTGGELVQAVSGKLFRHFVANENYGGYALLINTVHDCFVIDTTRDLMHTVLRDVIPILESVPDVLRDLGVDCPVRFPVDAEAGPNLLDLNHVGEEP